MAITASPDHEVVDRRRIELLEPGVPPAPVEHDIKPLSDADATALLARVRASATRATSAALDALPGGMVSISLRSWPPDFPDDLASLRRPPYDSRADSVLYRQILAEQAEARGWRIHLYEAAAVERQAARLLGAKATEILRGPRRTLGPPWTKDHRTALAATILAGTWSTNDQ